MDLEELRRRTAVWNELVSEYWDTRRQMEEAMLVLRQEIRDDLANDVIELLRTGGEHGVTNAQVAAVFDERLDGNFSSMFTDLPYLLAKQGRIVGGKERRLNKAGVKQLQRVWYLPEFDLEERR